MMLSGAEEARHGDRREAGNEGRSRGGGSEAVTPECLIRKSAQMSTLHSFCYKLSLGLKIGMGCNLKPDLNGCSR